MIATPAMPIAIAPSALNVNGSSSSRKWPKTSANAGVTAASTAVRPDGMNCAPQNSSA